MILKLKRLNFKTIMLKYKLVKQKKIKIKITEFT